MTDASNTAVGAVLQQYIDGQWQPISFLKKKLQPAEMRYTTFNRQLLALYLLEGRTFHVVTDHKPLVFAFQARPDRYTRRQCRHLDSLQIYVTSEVLTTPWLMHSRVLKPV